MSHFNFTFIVPAESSLIKPGTIMFLPSKEVIPKNAHTDSNLNFGAFNHPVVVLSCPDAKTIHINSVVKIAIMTSFSGTSIKKHLSTKGIKASHGATVAHRAGYLRVVTASKPHTKETLKMRNGKGMKRDWSYINCKDVYSVSLKALARYGFSKKEEVDAYQLTSHAVKLLEEEIGRRERKKPVKVKKT